MMDKIKEVIQLNNVVLTSMLRIGNVNLSFAGKILTKYGVSRCTGDFLALVFRHYPNMFSVTNGVEDLYSPQTIINYANYLNIYNHIFNCTSVSIQRFYQDNARHVPVISETFSRERKALGRVGANQQVYNIFPETCILSSSVGMSFPERVLIKEKNTLDKIQVSGIQNTCLTHNNWNISHNVMLNAVPGVPPSFKDINPNCGNATGQEQDIQNKVLSVRSDVSEAVKNFQVTLEKYRDLSPIKAQYETGVFSKLYFEGVNRFKTEEASHSRESEVLGWKVNSQQGHNVLLEIQTLSSSVGAGLLERIFTQEKNALSKVRASVIKNTSYLIHNTCNIAHNAMFIAAPEDLSSFRYIKPGQGDTGGHKQDIKDKVLKARVEVHEAGRSFQETSGKRRELMSFIVPNRVEAISKLSFERVKRIKAKTVSYPTTQQSIVALKSGGQYVNTQPDTFLANQNTATVKDYISNNKFEHNRLQLEPVTGNKGISAIQHERATELNDSISDIAYDNTAVNYIPKDGTRLHLSNEVRHKSLYKAGMNQGEINIGPQNKITQQGTLIHYKPVMREAVAEEQQPQYAGVHEKTASTRILSTPNQHKNVNNIDSQDISLLADQVFKILEKRIAIQKDRRGML